MHSCALYPSHPYIRMMIKNYFIIVLLLYQNAGATHKQSGIPDSLKGKSYDYYSSRITLSPSDSSRSLLYARCWLEKSKKEGNYRQLSLAYKAMLYNSEKAGKILYADSIVSSAKLTKDPLLIGSAYMTKGIIYYDLKKIKEALDNYLVADRYIAATHDSYQVHKVKYGIGLMKYYLGFYDEAISLLQQCTGYFEEENDRAYLNSLHALGLCYNKISKYDRCSAINQKGIAAGRELEELSMQPYFMLSEGVNQSSRHNYREAIRKLLKVLPDLAKNKDFANEAIANFYIAECYWSLHQEARALPFLKKVDSIFIKEHYIRPDLRKNYELLINYYKKKNDKETQLSYINTLFKVDSILTHNYKYLSTRIFKQYDTKELIKAKSDIEQSMKNQKILDFTIISSLTIIVGILVYRHFANKKLYRRRYEELMNRKPAANQLTEHLPRDTELEISPEVEKLILKNLEKFEQNKKYLEKEMNLVRLAAILHTNTKYASRIILRYRGKKFIEYINDLKIDHTVELLKTEKRYRNYTNKALGEEAGFGSTQNFTRAFNTRNKISPTYFIRELRKDLNE